MNMEIIDYIIGVGCLQFALLLASTYDKDDLSFFNPIRNYREWVNLNWFGVIFFTILLNITFSFFALGYWFYKLCTIGRQ